MGILAHVFKTQHTYLQTMFAATQQIASVAGLKATKVQSKSVSKVVKADIYPEFGTYPGGGESPIIPFGNEKNAEREVIHGRWGMLGVTGAWASENGTGTPWFTAGTLCTPDDCTAVADKFPGAVAPLAPEGSGYPSFWNVLIIETILVGGAEAYRTGMVDPVFDELSVGDSPRVADSTRCPWPNLVTWKS